MNAINLVKAAAVAMVVLGSAAPVLANEPVETVDATSGEAAVSGDTAHEGTGVQAYCWYETYCNVYGYCWTNWVCF